MIKSTKKEFFLLVDVLSGRLMVFTSTNPISYATLAGPPIVGVSPGKTLVNTSVVARVVRRHARIGTIQELPVGNLWQARLLRAQPLQPFRNQKSHTCFHII
jgi:hypothetical protein